MVGHGTLRVGFVPGVTPDRWAARFAQRGRGRLALRSVAEDDAVPLLRTAELDMALVRLPVDTEGLHCVRLYDEVPVVLVDRDHVISVLDEADQVDVADLEDEQLVLPERSGWVPQVAQQPWPSMTVAEAVEVVASGGGVAVLPMSLARLHHRRDVVHRAVRGLSPTTVALTWLIERDDEATQELVGVVKGRTARSSR